jgi:uncharacterized protein (TIGR03437 family)
VKLGNWFVLAILVPAAADAASSLTCGVTAVNAVVRSEGLAEQLGDIVLNCSGGTPNGTVTGALTVSLNVNDTNRLSAGNVVDAVLSVQTDATTGSAGATPVLTAPTVIGFGGINFTLSAEGSASLVISNIRGAVAQLGTGGGQPVLATLSWTSTDTNLSLDHSMVTIGAPRQGLFAGIQSEFVHCQGSPLPATVTVSNLFATGTALAATRVTEGSTNAFSVGTRFVLTYSGFPAGAQLFVPDAIAGSDATQPTSTPLIGGSSSGGVYTPGTGNGTLLLVRVTGTDGYGAGGTALYAPGAPGSGPATLDGATAVPLTNGTGIAVYQAADANGAAFENAEIPTWLGLAPTGDATATTAQSVTFGPVSTVEVATATDPIPRFLAVDPPPDCSMLGDCGSFPTLAVTAPTLNLTAQAGGPTIRNWISVNNSGGGLLGWTASVTYESGSNWATLAYDVPHPDGSGRLNLQVTPANLAPAIYQATLTIDAGPAGIVNLPLTLTVTPVPSINPAAPQVTAIVHAATWKSGWMVPGSLATVFGVRLAGNSVAVTFDGLAATLLYTGDTQINLMVPAALLGQSSTQMIITVDGLSSQPQTVRLTSMSPGIFAGGILNQDNSVNSVGNGAAGGSEIQVFATGLPPANVGRITAKINNLWITTPDYAGPAPGLTGVQQVNLRVPDGWPPMTTTVMLCATAVSGIAEACSPEAPLVVQ